MPSGYHHLTHCERCQIHALLHRGLSQREIGRELGRDPGTISRELSRNRGQRGYRHKQAHGRAMSRRRAASVVPRKMTPGRWEVVAGRLKEGWSPEQIAGRYRQQGEVMAGREWIYQHVRADRRAGGTLYLHLRRRGKKPNWRGGRHAGRGRIPGRVDIADRPLVVEEKSRIGDWELDTIVGTRHRGALVSSVDRGSKFTFLERVDVKTASAVAEAVTRRMGPIRDRVHTCTADNGKEFAGHREISDALGAGFYFATPYHSWERGLNEHTNGLVRQYFPKGTDFRKVTAAQVRAVEDRINHRPRKVLGYCTPAEVFAGVPAGP
ncbi:MAG: IS30 family transposase [Gammaproteobacteria bacterium]|nr:IS30 family transposase [Gammaproteobacteria bacterium]